ncbi:peroxiredoxin-5, mitochondrial-like [Haliotis rufescens]|uniref:peroxiredoxin-5, mitochondrial-like n=1 Tax=Haliotis rufescens TaxID=6454 RepID=UPI00201F51A9|nr:peroxiredoxin-5, mitochondrial-like [Haliotis rufescens]
MATLQVCRRLLSRVVLKTSAPVTVQSKRYLRVGDRLPNVEVYGATPNDVINPAELYKGKRGVLFSVVGAFTPGCSESHIPEYISNHQKFKEEGYDLICCVAVNDPFVMDAWGKELRAEGKIKMLADTRGEFTRAMGMQLDCTKPLGGWRSRRYSIVVEDSVIQQINEDPDHTGLVCLLCIKNMKSRAQAPP